MYRYNINFISAPCGSGKTYGACSYIKETLYDNNFLYVAPTCQLLAETAQEMRSMGLTPHVITHETHLHHVKDAVMDALEAATDCGCILLITWQAFVDLPYFPSHKNWQIIIDEIPQLDQIHKPKLPLNQRFLTDWVEIDSAVNERIALLKARDPGQLKAFLNEPRDDANDSVRDLLKDVLSPKKDVFVETNQWTIVFENMMIGKTDEENTVFAVSMLNPSLLNNTIMLGANFERSMLYEFFRRYHMVKFLEFEPIAKNLRTVQTSGRNIQIHYFLERSFFSKHKAKQETMEGDAVIARMDREAGSFFGEDPFLYVANNDRESQILEQTPSSKRIKVQSQGVNKYDSYHNIYFSAALNREPRHLRMLQDLGFNLDYVHQATTHEVIYQSVMRTSLRRSDRAEEVKILVPDDRSAKRLAELLGVTDATKVTKLGNIYTLEQKPLTGTERNQRSKANNLKERIFSPKPLQNPLIDENCHETGADLADAVTRAHSPVCYVTFFKNQYAKHAQDFVPKRYDNVQDFIADMRTFAKTLTEKKERFLFLPAKFDPAIDPKSGYRTQANFVCAHMLVLDFDGGKLSPDDFVRIFWTDAGRGQKHSFIICNSYSRSTQDPNRFRVIMFFRKPARSIAEYQAAFDGVISRIVKEAGYSIAEMGIDRACRSGNQPFFLPCTNRAFPDHAFFETYGTKTVEIQRYGIDPSAYLKTAQPQITVERATRSSINVTAPEDLSPELDEMKKQLLGMPKGTHSRFFDFAFKLNIHFRGGLAKVEAHLKDVAGGCPEMRAKAEDNLKTLKKASYRYRGI